MVQGHHDEAWTYATQSLDLATQTDSKKHMARAQLLQGEILTARGQLEVASQELTASIHLAEQIQTPRDVWLGKATLAKALAQLGTRMLEELAAHAEAVGATILWGRCPEERGAPPYWPWIQATRTYIAERDAEALCAEMGEGAVFIAEIIAQLRGKLPDLQPPPDLEPEQPASVCLMPLRPS